MFLTCCQKFLSRYAPIGIFFLITGAMIGVTNWPDLLVGLATAIIAVGGSVEILRDARAETKKCERRSS